MVWEVALAWNWMRAAFSGTAASSTGVISVATGSSGTGVTSGSVVTGWGVSVIAGGRGVAVGCSATGLPPVEVSGSVLEKPVSEAVALGSAPPPMGAGSWQEPSSSDRIRSRERMGSFFIRASLFYS